MSLPAKGAMAQVAQWYVFTALCSLSFISIQRSAFASAKVIHGVLVEYEGRAVTGNHRGMGDTRTESLHLILGQRSE